MVSARRSSIAASSGSSFSSSDRKTGDTFQNGLDGHQRVVPSLQVRGDARPGPLLRLFDQPGPHGIERDVADGVDQMFFVQQNRTEAALPQMARPAVPPVDAGRIAPMRFGERSPQAILIGGYQDHVNVVGHQAI